MKKLIKKKPPILTGNQIWRMKAEPGLNAWRKGILKRWNSLRKQPRKASRNLKEFIKF
jgi:hypothetical protein